MDLGLLNRVINRVCVQILSRPVNPNLNQINSRTTEGREPHTLYVIHKRLTFQTPDCSIKGDTGLSRVNQVYSITPVSLHSSLLHDGIVQKIMNRLHFVRVRLSFYHPTFHRCPFPRGKKDPYTTRIVMSLQKGLH